MGVMADAAYNRGASADAASDSHATHPNSPIHPSSTLAIGHAPLPTWPHPPRPYIQPDVQLDILLDIQLDTSTTDPL